MAADRESVFSTRHKANRIVVFWVAAFCFLAPSSWIGWGYGLGLVFGFAVLRPLFDWKERDENSPPSEGGRETA